MSAALHTSKVGAAGGKASLDDNITAVLALRFTAIAHNHHAGGCGIFAINRSTRISTSSPFRSVELAGGLAGRRPSQLTLP